MTATEAHIETQRRLREFAQLAVATAWRALPGYDEEHVDPFVAQVVPLVTAAQRQSVSVTDAYLARELGRRPLGIPRDDLIGAAARAGATPEHVYRRPFVTVWTALQNGTRWEEAVNAGLARAKNTAATDVQLAMRGTLQAVGEEDDLILGYQRVPDPGACKFCLLVAGQRYHKSDLMPIHPHCGCSVAPIHGVERPNFSGRYDRDQVAIHEHGELGPVLADPAHDFTTEHELA